MPIPTGSMRIAALAALGVIAAAGVGAEEALPQPSSLEPAVRFWTRVYTEVDASGGLIHDAEHLDVVYEVIDLPKGLSNRSREQRVEGAKSRIRAALRKLAQGKRSGLSSYEAELLARWPAGVSNSTLRSAALNLRFQLGQADRYREGLVRSGAWRDYIEETLRAHGVPVELAALPHVESSFNPGAYSRVGASGLWQFTRSTGRLFLQVDDVLDERLDPHRATVAAARLLRKNHELTQSWPLAITSYNHGAGGMQRAARTLGTRDIGRIVHEYKSRTFGFASRNFYTSFLAALHVDGNASRYFGDVPMHAPVAYERIELPHYYAARSLSSALGLAPDVLRRLNPALRPAVWQGSKHVPRGYTLQVPVGSLAQPASVLLAQVPESERLGSQHRDRYYRVRRGDTLSRIAARYGVRESELLAANDLRSRNRIRAGQVLVLPDGVGGSLIVARSSSTAETRTAQALPADGIHVVQRGDTLFGIAQRYGTSEALLTRENRLRNRNRIQPGQSLRIPGAQVVASAAAPAPEPAPVAVAKPSEPTREIERIETVAEPLAEIARVEPEARLATGLLPAAPPAPAAAIDERAEPPLETESALALQAAEESEDAAPDAELDPAGEAAPDSGVEVALAATAAAEPAVVPFLSDPSDYAVHPDGRVTVQAAETLGHYAEWLEVSASALRARNGMRARQPIVIGRRVRLDLSRVTPEEFERRRLSYHRTLQSEFFDHFTVTGTEQHVLRRGETLWYLAARKYRVPVWLLRQYNPDLDFGSLPTGSLLVVPQIEPRRS